MALAADAALFESRAYDGVSVDDLGTHLGVHRNSRYNTFGSKPITITRRTTVPFDSTVEPRLISLPAATSATRD